MNADTQFAFSAFDYVFFFLFLAVLSIIGYIAGRGAKKGSQEYFLAGNTLPWYVIGSSLVASILSTEHLIGMVGWVVLYGVSVGMWIWGLVIDITLLIFLWVPFLLASRVFTIPQFLEERFDGTIRVVFALITLAVNIMSFMAAVLYTGGLALDQLFGWNVNFSIVALGLVAGVWAIYGGLNSVAWTDVLTVTVTLIGGVVVVYLGVNALSDGSFIDNLRIMFERNQALDGVWAEAVAKHQHVMTDAPTYNRLSIFQPMDHIAAPTVGLLLSSLSIGIWYNVMNQYVIQRVLGARNAHHARIGIIFSGVLFGIVTFVIVIPGLVLFALQPEILLQDWGNAQTGADRSYIDLVQTVMPVGLRGLLLAALFGAIQAHVNAVLNSTATVFAMDVYQGRIVKKPTDQQLVRVGVWTSAISLFLAIAIAIGVAELHMSVFYYMQLLNAFFAAPFAALFMLGVLWRRMNTQGAKAALICGFGAAVLLKFAPDLVPGFPRWASTILNQAALVLAVSLIAGIVGALRTPPPRPEQVTDALTFSWSNPHLRQGWGTSLFTSAIFWWLIFVGLTAGLMIYFSPLVFPS